LTTRSTAAALPMTTDSEVWSWKYFVCPVVSVPVYSTAPLLSVTCTQLAVPMMDMRTVTSFGGTCAMAESDVLGVDVAESVGDDGGGRVGDAHRGSGLR